MPAPEPVYEEVRGVRHGKEVLESLGMLPASCEIVYEEPKQINVNPEAVGEVPVGTEVAPQQDESSISSAAGDTSEAEDLTGYGEGVEPVEPVQGQSEDTSFYEQPDGSEMSGTPEAESEGYEEEYPQEEGAVPEGDYDQQPSDFEYESESDAYDDLYGEDDYGQTYDEDYEQQESVENGVEGSEASAAEKPKSGVGQKIKAGFAKFKGLFSRHDDEPIAIRRGKDTTDGEDVDYSEFEIKYEGNDTSELEGYARPNGASFAAGEIDESEETLLPVTPEDMPQTNAGASTQEGDVETDAEPNEESSYLAPEASAESAAAEDDLNEAVAPVAEQPTDAEAEEEPVEQIEQNSEPSIEPESEESAAAEVVDLGGARASEDEGGAEDETSDEDDVEVVSVAPDDTAEIPAPIRMDEPQDYGGVTTADTTGTEDREAQSITTQYADDTQTVAVSRSAKRQPRPESVSVVKQEATEIEAEVVGEEQVPSALQEDVPEEAQEPQDQPARAAENLDWDQPAVEDEQYDAASDEAWTSLETQSFPSDERVEGVASDEGSVADDTAEFGVSYEDEYEYGDQGQAYEGEPYGAEPAGDSSYDEQAYTSDGYYDAEYDELTTSEGEKKPSVGERMRGAFGRLRKRLSRKSGTDTYESGVEDFASAQEYGDEYGMPAQAASNDAYEDSDYPDADYADSDYSDESLEDGYADYDETYVEDSYQDQAYRDQANDSAAAYDSADAAPVDDEDIAEKDEAERGAVVPSAQQADGQDSEEETDSEKDDLRDRVTYLELGDEDEQEDILPKDTTGLDTLTDDAYGLDEDEETVQPRTKPRPIDDPNWGTSSYEPPATTPNIARRAALFDLPDVSGETIDPLTGSKDYQDDDEDQQPDDTETQQPEASEGLGDTAEFDASTDDPTSPLRGWKGGAALRSDLRDDGLGDVVDDIDEPDDVYDTNETGAFDAEGDIVSGNDAVKAEDASTEESAQTEDSGNLDAGDLQDAILELGDDYLIAHDIWFVCVGGSEMDHAGAKSFIANFRRDIRGSFLVNLDSVGAGQLVVLTNEGYDEGKRADRRSIRLLTETASDLDIQLDKIDYGWEETDATCAMRSRVRSLTIMGMDENGLPALSHTDKDVPMNIDPKQVASVARLICEFIRRS